MFTETIVCASSSFDTIALPPGSDEGVVVEVETDAVREVVGRREAPEDPVLRIDEEHPVVAAVGDQERSGQRHGHPYSPHV